MIKPNENVVMDTNKPLRVMYINRSDKNNKNWLHFKHSHFFSEIFYNTGGSGEFIIEDRHIVVEKGDVVYISPNIEHTELSSYTNPLEYFVIGADGVSFLSDHHQPIPYLKFKDSLRQLIYYFYQGHDEFSHPQKNSQLIVGNLVNTLLLLIERDQSITLKHEKTTMVNPESALIKNYIDIHFKEGLTLDSLASHFHVNKYHLSHVFKKDYHVAPIKYLNKVRVENVKFLLASTNYSILKIATINGFTSQSYLAQMFKKEVGISPVDYRKAKNP